MKRRGSILLGAVLILAFFLVVIGIWGYENNKAALSRSAPSAQEASSTPGPAGNGCVVLPYAGTTPLSQLPLYSPDMQDIRGGMVCTFLINKKLPLFTFHFIGEPNNTLGDIQVTEGTSTNIIQTIGQASIISSLLGIDSSGPNYSLPLYDPTQLAGMVDANFDGYNDLSFEYFAPADGENQAILYYLYDPVKNRFVYNSFLSGGGNITFDDGKKQVTNVSLAGLGTWEEDVYQYQNGQYSLIKKVSANVIENKSGSGSFQTIQTYMLEGGVMKLMDSTSTTDILLGPNN